MNNKVYIVLINFNSWKDTLECVESVLCNAYKNYQLVIVDNCSTDDSVERFKAWAKRSSVPSVFFTKSETDVRSTILQKESKTRKKAGYRHPVVFIQSDTNDGFSAGNNIGIKYGLIKMDADYFWLLNNDTIIDTNALRCIVETASKNPSCGIVGSKLLFYHDPETIQTLGTVDVGWKGVGNGDYDGVKDSEALSGLIRTKSIIGAAFFIKQEVIERIGLMDEDYFMHHEESDWCTRAIQHNYSLLVDCRSRVLHKEGASTDRRRIVKSFFGRKVSRTTITDFLMWGYYSFRNEIYFVKKNFPKKYSWFLSFILPKKLFIKIVSLFLFNDDHKIKRIFLVLKAFIDGIRGKMGKTIDPLQWKKSVAH